MIQPEVMIRSALTAEGIEALTTLDDWSRDDFVVIVRTSDGRDYRDVNRTFVTRNYNLLLQVFSNRGKKAVAELADQVIDIVDGLFWHDDVEASTYAGGAPLPAINGHDGYSVSYLVTMA